MKNAHPRHPRRCPKADAFHPSAGFTIIEVLVAVGLASILSLGIAGMLNGVMDGQKRMEMKNTTITKHGIISSTLADSALCAKALALDHATPVATLAAVNLASPFLAQDLDHLEIARTGGTPTIILKKNDPVAPGVFTQSITLALQSFIGDIGSPVVTHKQYAGLLTVKYDFTADKKIAMQPQVYDMLVTADATTGVITSCNGSGAGLSEQQVCQNSFGGTFLTSGATPHCTLLGGTTTIGATGVSIVTGGLTVSAGGANVTGASTFQNNVQVVGDLNGVRANFTGNVILSGAATLTSPTTNAGATTVSSLAGSGGNATGFNQIFANQVITPSDRRLKDNIQALRPQTELMNQILTYTYNYKSDLQKKRRVGVIAQELQSLYPNLVEQDDKGSLSVNYVELIPYLIKSLQESNKRIDGLEEKLKRLEKTKPKN